VESSITKLRNDLLFGLVVLVTLRIPAHANAAEFGCVNPDNGRIDRLVSDRHQCPKSDKFEFLARLTACVGDKGTVQQLIVPSGNCGDGQTPLALAVEEPSDASAASASGDEHDDNSPKKLAFTNLRKEHPLEVIDVKFSNTAKDGSPLSGPTDRLDVSTVMFVEWKIKFKNQLYQLDSGKYRVDATYIAPDGRTLGSIVDWKTVPATDRNATFTGRIGNSNGGAFLPGTYIVNFFLNGKYIAQKKFDVVGTVSGSASGN